jgi:hypothetical protein
MRWFLERISSRSVPIIFGNETRQKHQSDFDKLVKKKILVRSSNLAEVDCELCDEGHQCQIREDKGHLFYICENGAGKKEINDKDAALFQYDYAAFRQLLASELGLKTDGNGKKDARYIGQYQGQRMKANVFHLRTDDDAERGGLGSGPRVLVSNTGIAGADEDGVFYCALSDILVPSPSKNIFDKAAFEKCVSGAKRISFDKKNGQLYFDGKRIYTAPLKGIEFYFLSYLWDNWEKQSPYGDIHHFVRDKMGKTASTDWTDTAQKFCQKVKSGIKKSCRAIDKIITKPKTGHYMMADPLA